MKRAGSRILGTCLLGMAGLCAPLAPSAWAKEKVTLSTIPVSVYGAWYIAKEKGFAKDIEIDVKIIEDLDGDATPAFEAATSSAW